MRLRDAATIATGVLLSFGAGWVIYHSKARGGWAVAVTVLVVNSVVCGMAVVRLLLTPKQAKERP